MFGEYIQSNQGTTRDIYGNIRSSAVDGRSPYVTSDYGTVDTLQLRDGRQVRVSAVDGDSPYIVARSNPTGDCSQPGVECPEGESCLHGDGTSRCVNTEELYEDLGKKTRLYFGTLAVLFVVSTWGGYRLGRRLF